MNSRASKNMARPLGVRGYQKPSFLTGSYKVGGGDFVESPKESTTMLALEVDPRVVCITPQPFTIRLDIEKVFSAKSEAIRAEPRSKPQSMDGEKPLERIYTPDFLVGLTTPVPLVVETKSATEIERIGEALERRGRVLNSLGFNYLVVPNTEVGHQGLHSNLGRMRDAMKYCRENDISALLGNLETLVGEKKEQFLLAELKNVVPDWVIHIGIVSGVIACDMRSGHFSINTVLRKAHGDLSHLQLLKLGS